MKVRIKRKEGLLKRLVKKIKKLCSRRFLKNKIYGILLIVIGYFSMNLLGDGTAFILLSILGLIVFFETEYGID